jgi:hypothetical protein
MRSVDSRGISSEVIPADFMTTWERTGALERLLDSKPEASATLRRFTGVRSNKEQAMDLDLFIDILDELHRRWGGNAFDNQTTIYTGGGDDVAVNDGVKRHRADDRARALAVRDYTPTGRLERPLLSLRVAARSPSSFHNCASGVRLTIRPLGSTWRRR